MAKRKSIYALGKFKKDTDAILKELEKMYKKMLLSMNTLLYSTFTHVTLSQSDITYPMEKFHGEFVNMFENNLSLLNKFFSMRRKVMTQLKKGSFKTSNFKKQAKVDFDLLAKYRSILIAIVKRNMSRLKKEEVESIEKLVIADYNARRIKPIELPRYFKKYLAV